LRKSAPLFAASILVVLTLFTACVSTGDGRSLSAGVDTDWKADDFKYRIAAGDELGVRFPLNPDLNAQVTVGPDGRGVFPLVSGVRVSGLTVEQVDEALTKAYASVLRKPIIQTQIYNYIAGQIYVMGELKEPGVKQIRGEMTVTQGIAAGGGFLPTARSGKVVVLRRRPGDGRALMRTVDINGALRGDEAGNLRLLPGDVVFVPRSQIAEVNRIVQQYVTNALPFSLNYQLNSNGTNGVIR
jgi:protein involved in polysaccharide export with SLBB domain